MASFAASAIGSKAISDGAAGIGQKIITHFRETLPGQQEFIREIRKAQLNALKKIAARNDQALKQLPSHESASEEHAFSAAFHGFIAARLKTLSDKSIDFGVLTDDRIQDVLDFMVHPSPDATLANLQALARKRAEAAIIAETEADAGRAMPSRLRNMIEGTGSAGWYDFFSVEVSEQLKTNEHFKSVFLFAELADIKNQLTNGFNDLKGHLDAQTEAITNNVLNSIDRRVFAVLELSFPICDGNDQYHHFDEEKTEPSNSRSKIVPQNITPQIEMKNNPNQPIHFAHLLAQASAHYSRGILMPTSNELEVAVDLAQAAVSSARTQFESGAALNLLGIALATLAERAAEEKKI